MAKFYVYEHWRLDRDECFYVGKGTRYRAYEMCSRNPHHKAVMAKLARIGSAAEVRIVRTGLSEEEAFALEVERIAFWNSVGVDLTNMTNGGEGASGYVYSEERKASVSQRFKGKKQTPEWIEKRAAKHRGRKMSAEEKKKREEISKKRWTPEARAEFAARMTEARKSRIGIPFSDEHKRKLSESHKALNAARRLKKEVEVK